MTIARDIATGAMLACLALALTAPVSGATPLDGHYIETETFPDGNSRQSDWFISSCGDGCADIKHLGQAKLVDGQWTLDGRGGVSCEEGGDIRDAIHLHYTWDATTLDGTARITNNVAACGNPAGYQETNTLHLQPAP